MSQAKDNPLILVRLLQRLPWVEGIHEPNEVLQMTRDMAQALANAGIVSIEPITIEQTKRDDLVTVRTIRLH